MTDVRSGAIALTAPPRTAPPAPAAVRTGRGPETEPDKSGDRRKLPERWLKEFALARRSAVRGLVRDGVGAEAIPTDPPYTVDQVIDPDWWPANRHGLPS